MKPILIGTVGLGMICTATVAAPVATPSRSIAVSSFACEQDGGSKAIASACAARWAAANARAHAAMGSYWGSSRVCLAQYAAVLEKMATEWVTRGVYTGIDQPLPCGPHVGEAANHDDGLLAKLCPGQVWSYDNHGAVSCDIEHLYLSPPPTLSETEKAILMRAASGPPPASSPTTHAPDAPQSASWIARAPQSATLAFPPILRGSLPAGLKWLGPSANIPGLNRSVTCEGSDNNVKLEVTYYNDYSTVIHFDLWFQLVRPQTLADAFFGRYTIAPGMTGRIEIPIAATTDCNIGFNVTLYRLRFGDDSGPVLNPS